MTFGTARWGLDEAGSAAVFHAYVEAGGNFVDTADVYAGGRSEEMLGSFIAERKLRDQIVVATKAGFAAGRGVHTGGNGAKHLHAALEGSLRRLRTDYVDLFWIHVWDSMTPAEELLETMTALVRAGRIRYWGMSNTPAWYVAKLATLAAVRGVPGPIALQYFYSLVNRDIEDEHAPLAKEFGMGIVPWSPLAYGLLTGKYDRATVEAGPRVRAGCRVTPRLEIRSVRKVTNGWMARILSATRSLRRATGRLSMNSRGCLRRLRKVLPAWRSPGFAAELASPQR